MTRRHATSARRATGRRNWWLLAAAGVLSLPGGPYTQESVARSAPAEPAEWAANDGFSPSPPSPTKKSPSTDASGQANASAALEKLPIYFIENRGQADPRVAYYVQGGTTGVYFTREGITFSLTGSASETKKRWAVKLDFVGANPDVKPIGRDKTAAVVSYFKEKPEKWHTGLPTYGTVVYEDLWPGIDLVYSGTASRVKYTFMVEPGADPNLIQLAYRGAAGVRVTEDGRLAVETPAGGLEDDAPYAYQEIDGKRVDVSARFALEAVATQATYRYGFRVGAYDRSRPLILDPVILSYCGYIGGLSTDSAQGAAVDSGGNLYVVGYTSSTDASFPETTGPYLTNSGSFDAFVAKVNPSGTALIYCGYIGGSADDNAFAVAVESAGNAYVVGRTASTETTFPVSVGPYLTYGGGPDDAFVAKVNVAGTALVYCGYIGGADGEGATGVAVDSSGNAYVAGSTASRASSFPETVGPDLSYNGGSYDVFVAKVNAAGSALVYCGYIGGANEDQGQGIAVDASGNAYVAGSTLSDESKFPVTGGPDSTFNGGLSDAFVAKVNAGGTGLVYCGYIGGSSDEGAYGIAVDASGSAYVTGSTSSTPPAFPVTVGPDLTLDGIGDAFVAKVSPSGATLTYCGYIGGSGQDVAYGIALDSSGNAYVTGETDSDQASFPVTGGPSGTYGGGLHDAFVAKVNASGTTLSYAGYIGGTGDDFGRAIAVQASGGYAYVVGVTNSTETDFPVTTGPDLTQNGFDDAFVARIEDTLLTSFKCRKPITIDRTKVGDVSTTTLSNFPMLFSVTDANLKTTAYGGDVNNANGYDIMFRALDSTTCGGSSSCNLGFEVEKYVPTTGELVAWVRLPSVNGQAAGSNTTIYLYYGNASVTSPWENAGGVWDSNYKGVWHLKEDPAGATLVQSKTASVNSDTSLSASLDSTPRQGNLLVAVVGLSDNRDLVAPPGWSTAIATGFADGSPTTGIFYKVAGASESRAVSVGNSGAATALALHIYEYAGVATSSPLDLTATCGGACSTGSPVPTGTTAVTSQDGELLIAAAAVRQSVTLSSWSNSFIARNSTTTGGNIVTLFTTDRGVSATGTYSSDASYTGTSAVERGMIATFKLAVKDSTSNANHGTAFGQIASTQQVSGKVDGSLDFVAASDNRVSVGDTASLGFTGRPNMTVSAWVRADSLPNTWHGIYSNSVGGNCNNIRYGFLVNGNGGSGVLELDIGDGVGCSTFYTAAGTISTGSLHHVAVTTESNNNIKFYINGAQSGSTQTLDRDLADSTLAWLIARSYSSGNYDFDGIIDELRVSDVARAAAWISTEYNNQNSPSTFYSVGAAECSPATAVELSALTATGYDRSVLIEWTSGSELKNLGFHLYRASSEEGPYERITASAIPGLGSSPVGASYRYVDSGLTNGQAYFYKLEDIETTGVTEQHGPVTATPSPESPMPSALPGSSSGAGLTYGDPSLVSLRVLERSENQMVLELRTGGFYAEPRPDGSMEMTIPGFVTESEPGAASIPVWRSWLDVVAERNVRIASVRADEVEVFSSLKPSLAESSEIVASPRGVVRLARRPQSEGSSTRGVQPEKVARIVTAGYQADVKKALVELAPLRWSRRGLSLARRLTVRLVFSGLDDLARHRESPSHQRQSVVRRLVTQERGLYGASFEEVMGSRREAIETTSLRLSRQGQAVAFHVEPDNGVFAPGSTLYFLSEGSSLNAYGHEAVYELERGQGLTMPVDSIFASGPSVGFYWQRLVREENRYYQAGLLEAEDLWLWDLLFAPVRKVYSFALPGLASTSQSSRFQVGLQGVSDFPEELDHHVRVYVNGTLLAEASLDGKKGKQLTGEIPPGVLREGMNQLAIENVGDTGAAYSMVMLDRYEISYPRMPRPAEPTLEGSFGESGVIEIGQRLALDITEPAPRWLNVEGSSLRVEAGRKYLAVSPATVLRPLVEARQASRLKSRLNRADYVVVGPKAFLEAALPLLNRRRSQGLRAQAVPVEEVYSEFGFGEPRPQAIKDFLAYAYHRWRRPSPRYVLLLGDGTYDFKGYLGTGVQNQVPPLLVKTSFLWTASDPAYASVNGEDPLPDLAIGRLPAASVGEVRVMVKKILDYEASGSLSRGPVVLVADNPDDAGNFVGNAEALAGGVLVSRNRTKVYLSELGRDATRAAIVDAFERGASLLSYIGHGGIHLLASENVFDDAEVSALAPQSQQPVVLTLNCLNGYFHFPYFNSLAEELTKADGKGAIAAFSPSGLSVNGPAHLFHERLLRALVSGEHRRLGDAVLSAQAAYAATGAFPELLQVYHLLGDPALQLR